ncbi:NAD(P)H-dependent amine dehydrogenase family protein [Streptomyces fuscichromogenes]|uniref:Dihydrodipicolinate reductase n=1 Tax=Streptomyces fuscichromogenes TaxID=1324013 RepID=A0A917XLV1_9ACTN|nr:dihydrodipicolinate reductase [Streptomyces fuscichromogenes]GGN36679.1 dihydrodipicolinate reductase [Streptomyces fuscichromogenes]
MSTRHPRDPERRLRVVQWATGNIGSRSLRAVVDHPRMALAGVYVSGPDKAGRDAGELCGSGPTGVVTTCDPDEILALGADCVLYMPRATDPGELCALLASGANVVTTAGGFHHPPGLDPGLRLRIEEACARGGTSLHATGSSPGFITEAVPLVLASVQRRLEKLTVHEYADLSRRNSPGLLFDVMGFGETPAGAFDEGRLAHVRSGFGPSLRLVADALGLPLESVEARGRTATAVRTTAIAAGVLRAGTVAAQRVTLSGRHGGRTLLEFDATWYCTTELDVDWDLRATGWHLTVDGDTPLDIDMRFPVPLERLAAVSPGYTAHRAVNAVPAVCAAAPGIRTTVDLPLFTAVLG